MNLDEAILKILHEHKVGTQAEMMEHLKTVGVEANQSKLSRHLRKLGVRKIGRKYVIPEQKSPALPEAELVPSPPNMIVVKTIPGHANVLAYHIDLDDMPEIAGSVAGDDTVLIALAAGADVNRVAAKLAALLNIEADPD